MLTTFATVYAQPDRVLRQQKLKRLAKCDEDEDTSSSEDEAARSLPFTRNDPYRIAGWSRDKSIPAYPFPHAAESTAEIPDLPIAAQLLSLNPPVLAPLTAEDESSAIASRAHLDNLTILLHRCVAQKEWKRAQRCLALMLRSRQKVDLRLNGTWMLAAEVLMRSHESEDEGLQAARQFFERLILQYPLTLRTAKSWNASAVYPSLFNVWIYQAQLRSKFARVASESNRSSRSPVAFGQDDQGDTESRMRHDDDDDHQRVEHEILQQELKEAKSISDRLNQLISLPPYDTDKQLLDLQAMAAKWVTDLRSQTGQEDND